MSIFITSVLLLSSFSVMADLTFNWGQPASVVGVTETGYNIYCDGVLLTEVVGFDTVKYVEPAVGGNVPDGLHSCDMETVGVNDAHGTNVVSARSVPVEFHSINGSLVIAIPNPTTGLFMTP